MKQKSNILATLWKVWLVTPRLLEIRIHPYRRIEAALRIVNTSVVLNAVHGFFARYRRARTASMHSAEIMSVHTTMAMLDRKISAPPQTGIISEHESPTAPKLYMHAHMEGCADHVAFKKQ